MAEKYVDSDNYSITLIDSIHVLSYDNNRERLFFIISSEICNYRGYNGNTTLGILFNSTGIKKRVNIICSEDTPSFVRRIANSDFLSQLGSKQKIRPISGATITCKAIEKTIQRCLDDIENLLLN
ncbi:MAG: FMN-binding protein [Candidatus Cloacimonetes bacterium]|nr:FMN-binding protein [Candidatus Cloacimonadota bacterium]